MSMKTSELLEALDKSGSADTTIDLGKRALRHGVASEDDPRSLITYFKDQGITEGTLHKAEDLLSGRKKPDDYLGQPPRNSGDARTAQMLKTLTQEMTDRILEQVHVNQSERQAMAQGAGIGNPAGQKDAIIALAKAKAGK